VVKFKVDVDNIQIDRFLKTKLNIGMRQIKRLFKDKRIFINNKPCNKRIHILKKGDIVTIKNYSQEVDIDLDLKIIKGNDQIFAVFKPPNFHTVSGKSAVNMEYILSERINKRIYLLNRLDYLTSGLILFCFSDEVVKNYKEMQDRGLIEKRYLALVNGKISDKVLIKNFIDDKKRKKVRTFDYYDKDKLRYTYIIPKKYFEKHNHTLVEARIFKGKRHQIRAHLSYIGHPIVGDPLYGNREICSTRMFLHHYMVISPDFVLKIDKNFG